MADDPINRPAIPHEELREETVGGLITQFECYSGGARMGQAGEMGWVVKIPFEWKYAAMRATDTRGMMFVVKVYERLPDGEEIDLGPHLNALLGVDLDYGEDVLDVEPPVHLGLVLDEEDENDGIEYDPLQMEDE